MRRSRPRSVRSVVMGGTVGGRLQVPRPGSGVWCRVSAVTGSMSGSAAAASRTSSFPVCDIGDQAGTIFVEEPDLLLGTINRGLDGVGLRLHMLPDRLLLYHAGKRKPETLDLLGAQMRNADTGENRGQVVGKTLAAQECHSEIAV